MKPSTYCQDRIQHLRDRVSGSPRPIEGHQQIAILAYFAAHQPSEQDFASELEMLAEGAERSKRMLLATAARSILSDWQRQSQPS